MKKPYPVPKQFLGAFKCGHRTSAHEFIDDDLAYTLLNKILDSNWTDLQSISELEYITKFNNEYHKNVVSKESPLHPCHCPAHKKGDRHLQECPRKLVSDRENCRNRDLSSIMKDSLVSTEPMYSIDDDMDQDAFLNENRNLHSHEDILIDLISSDEFQASIDRTKKKQKN